MTKNEYNGWYNYETWCVNLWMDNDQGSQGYWAERAQECYNDTAETTFHRTETAVGNLADEIQGQHEDFEAMGVNVTGVYADLLNAALSEVNWYEIASHLIDDVEKE
jgi:hypothetical protein